MPMHTDDVRDSSSATSLEGGVEGDGEETSTRDQSEKRLSVSFEYGASSSSLVGEEPSPEKPFDASSEIPWDASPEMPFEEFSKTLVATESSVDRGVDDLGEETMTADDDDSIDDDGDSSTLPFKEEILEEEVGGEAQKPDEELDAHSPLFSPPLYRQRYSFVREMLIRHRVKSVVDFGCSEPKLLERLRYDEFESLSGVDLLRGELDRGLDLLRPMPGDYLGRREKPLTTRLFCGSMLQRDARLTSESRCDAATMIEVVEHLEDSVLAEFPATIFGFYRPRVVVMTTPNVEFNVVFGPNFSGFRHWDHKFEWTRREFEDWCRRQAATYSYEVTFHGIGDAPPPMEGREPWGAIGKCSQAAIFLRMENREESIPIDEVEAAAQPHCVVENPKHHDTSLNPLVGEPLELVGEFVFPSKEPVDEEGVKAAEIYYYVHRMSTTRVEELETQFWGITNNEQFEDEEDAAAVPPYVVENEWPPDEVDVELATLRSCYPKLEEIFPDIDSLVEKVKKLCEMNAEWRLHGDGAEARLWVKVEDDNNNLSKDEDDEEDHFSTENYDAAFFEGNDIVKVEEENWDDELEEAAAVAVEKYGDDDAKNPETSEAEARVAAPKAQRFYWERLPSPLSADADLPTPNGFSTLIEDAEYAFNRRPLQRDYPPESAKPELEQFADADDDDSLPLTLFLGHLYL